MFVDTYHSRIGFTPDALTICGQSVNVIQWDTASRQNNEDVWNNLTGLPKDGQTCLTHDNFCDLLQDVEGLILRRVTICTDQCTLDILPYDRQTITLTLTGQEPFTFHATPRFEAGVSQTVQVLHTALFFLSCKTLQDAEKKLAKLQMLGGATPNLP